MKNILFFSTNDIWSGSEVLWYRSAKKFINEGYHVGIITSYTNLEIKSLKIPNNLKLNLKKKNVNISFNEMAKCICKTR